MGTRRARRRGVAALLLLTKLKTVGPQGGPGLPRCRFSLDCAIQPRRLPPLVILQHRRFRRSSFPWSFPNMDCAIHIREPVGLCPLACSIAISGDAGFLALASMPPDRSIRAHAVVLGQLLKSTQAA